MDTFQIIAWIIWICLAFYGLGYYIKETLSGNTTPHVFSWIIWVLLTVIAFFIQLQDGWGIWAWVMWITAIISGFIVILSLKWWQKNITKNDTILFIWAMIALMFWLVLDNPLISIILVTLIDALGFIPTLRKTYHKPWEETLHLYTSSGIKHALSMFAMANYSIITLIYPFSLVITNLIVVIFVIVRKKQLRK